MKYVPPRLSERITLHVGQWWAGKEDTVLATLLGSCVAACLYDPVSLVCGMNHFLLANPRYARNLPVNFTEAGTYGVNAMELLINDMMKHGAEKRRLQAKVFGGGMIFKGDYPDSFTCVGEINQRFIRDFLHDEGIPIVSEDLGGRLGRYIYFETGTMKVYRHLIDTSEAPDIEATERTFWKEAITEHETLKNKGVVLFDK